MNYNKHTQVITLLLVEDSPTQAQEVAYFLEQNGYQVTLCKDGQEAFDWLQAQAIPPDVIISDVVMPRMDGYQLCKAIRDVPSLEKIPVILLTSLSEPQDIIKSIEAGANKFLTKPPNPKRLIEVIEELHINTLRRNIERMEMGIRLVFGGKDFLITADKVQILDLLLSSYEESYYQNLELRNVRTELEHLNSDLEMLVQQRTAELHKQEELYRSLTENTPDFIMRVDPKQTILYTNYALKTFFKTSSEELLGQPLITFATLTNQADLLSMFEQALATGKEVRKVLQVNQNIQNNREAQEVTEAVWLDTTFVPEFDSAKQVQSVLIVTRDITEHKRMEQSLHDQEQLMLVQSKHAAMGEMIGMIAHQWRQPITVIAMGANNLIADIQLENVDLSNFEYQANQILKQTDYLSKTIEDFRNYFRPNKQAERTNICNLMQESLQIIGKSLEHSQISVETDFAEISDIWTYSRELMQVFINILKNAKEALVENRADARAIKIQIKEYNDSINVQICDNGGGIPAEIIDKIFNPYFTTKDKMVGTGLGLYMSKTIIEKHLHGTISVKNQLDGACFLMTLQTLPAGKLGEQS